MSKNKRDEKGSIENAKTNHETIRNEKDSSDIELPEKSCKHGIKSSQT